MRRRCARLLRLLPVTSLAVTTLLTPLMTASCAAAQNAGRPSELVSAAGARGRIEAHISSIENPFKAMNALYAYGAAERTLKDAFRKQGVTYSLGYVDSWGNNGLWLTWEQALIFYRYHQNALQESRSALPVQGFVSGTDLAYLDEGMRGWQEHEQQLDKHMQEMVALYLRLAASLDKKFALEERYARQRVEASRRNDSRRIDALKVEEAEALKPLKLEANQLYEARDKLRVIVEEHAKKRFFEAIKARGANPRTTSRNATAGGPKTPERKNPEPLVISGKAPGANETEKP